MALGNDVLGQFWCGQLSMIFLSLVLLFFPDLSSAQVEDEPQAIPETYSLPADIQFKRVVAGFEEGRTAQGPQEKLIYSNTLGLSATNFPANQPVSDDIAIIAAGGCNLTRYRFKVLGKVLPAGVGGPYTVTYGLYSNCPLATGSTNAIRDLVKIPGTDGVIAFDDESPREIEHVVNPETPVALPTNFYLSLRFNRANCGTLIGTPALIGFSGDVWDFPGSPCNGWVGGFPLLPHASIWAEFWGDSACAPAFSGYKCQRPSGAPALIGANIQGVDDVKLIVDNCQMIGYEVVVKGVGFYTFDLRRECNGDIIPGTQKTFQVNVSTQPQLQVARFSFNPPITLTTNSIYVGFKGSSNSSGTVLAGIQPIIGESEDEYFDIGLDGCAPIIPTQGVYGAINLGITCAGALPLGACCDPYVKQCSGGPDEGKRCDFNASCVGGTDEGARCSPSAPCDLPGVCTSVCAAPGTCEAVCREIPEINCFRNEPDPNQLPIIWRPWVEGAHCGPSAFPHACGVFACCKPDDTCENLTANHCNAIEPLDRPRVWQTGEFCEDRGHSCPFNACLAPQGDCSLTLQNGGCWDPFCCGDVCTHDLWCCTVEWDTVCLSAAQELCSGIGPRNAECRYALEASVNSSIVMSNLGSTFWSTFTCHRESPDIQVVGTTWFVFEAVDSSVRIHSCNTDFPGRDTLIEVLAFGGLACDPGSASAIACNDDAAECGSSFGSDLCVTGLVPGNRYHIKVAVHSEEDLGIFELDIESPCPTGSVPTDQIMLSEVSVPIAPTSSNAGADPQMHTLRDAPTSKPVDSAPIHREFPRDPWMPRPEGKPAGSMEHCGPWAREDFESVQVNVDANGCNIRGDAANEPSIAVDPTNPNRIVIGWRQFDTILSDFRQAGYGFSHDAGRKWTFPGVLDPGVFRSDPVLDADANGNVHYYSLSIGIDYTCDNFVSADGGVTWPQKSYGFGGDKAWMTIDRTGGIGRGNLYAAWTASYGCCGNANFTRSTDGGITFMSPIVLPGEPHWGTITVGPAGEVYIYGLDGLIKSLDAQDPGATPTFTPMGDVYLGSGFGASDGPNPGGLLGQSWVACDHSNGPSRGNVYVLASDRSSTSGQDPLDVMFARSIDGGESWSAPIRVNDDPRGKGAWHWFGTMSVAPNGRIDAIWNDTRNSGEANLSELYYSYSSDHGETWSENMPVSPMWDSWIGWPQQDKIGDYYHMVSDDNGANIAYAATYNGEQDVYFLRIGPRLDCNGNGVVDQDDVLDGLSADCDGDLLPDECQPDFDGDGVINNCDPDMDNDGVPNSGDACDRTPTGSRIRPDGRPLSDTTGHCDVRLADYWRFRNCMVNGRLGFPAPADACLSHFDYDQDGQVNLRDFAGVQNAYGGK